MKRQAPHLAILFHIRRFKLRAMDFLRLVWRGEHLPDAPDKQEDYGAHGEQHDEKAGGGHGKNVLG
jgi:hypothetical protein